MKDDHFKLIESLIKAQAENLEQKAEMIADSAAKKAVNDIMPEITSRIKEVRDAAVIELTGESYDDPNGRRLVRQTVQWSARQMNKVTMVAKSILLITASTSVAAIVTYLISKTPLKP